MGERTINKNKLPAPTKFEDRAGHMRFGRTEAIPPDPNNNQPGVPPKLWIEIQLQGAGAHWYRVDEKDLSPAFVVQLNKACDDAATELEGVANV